MKPCPHCQSAPDLLLGGASGASDVCLVFCGSDCSFDTIVAEPASKVELEWNAAVEHERAMLSERSAA
jgi:hypothetical protein